METDVTQERLKTLLDYDPETGLFRWKSKAVRNGAHGGRAGNTRPKGYVCIRIDGRLYMAHRLAWLYVHGMMPTQQIDHINQIKSDNRIDNLREASPSQNGQNRSKPRRDNKAGFLGVQRKGNRWIALIGVNGKQQYLGMFATPEAAHQAYQKAKAEAHPFAA